MLIDPEYPSTRFGLIFFLFTLFAAIILYLATNIFIVSAVLPCLHAGWGTFSTGLWLLRNDAHRIRARICFTFYIAAAFWKAALAALLTVGLYVFAAIEFGFQPNMDGFAATMITLFGGVIVNTIIGIGASIAAYKHKIRVWINPHLRSRFYSINAHSRIKIFFRQLQFNYAIFIVGTAVVFPSIIFGTVCLTIMTWDIGINHVPSIPELVLEFGLIFGGPIAMIPCYIWLSSRIIARNPRECWPDWFIKSTGSPN